MKSHLIVISLLGLALVTACGEAARFGDAATATPVPSPTPAAIGSASEPQPSATSALSAFPTQEPTIAHYTALLRGTLAVVDGCLGVAGTSEETTADFASVVWPYGYTWSIEDGTIALHDDTGAIVARLGDAVVMGGGNVPSEGFENACGMSADVWLAAPGVQTAAAEAIPTPVPPAPDIEFPQTKSPSAGVAVLDGVLVQDGDCLRVDAGDGSGSYLVIWPPGVAPRSEFGSIILDDGSNLDIGWMGVANYRGWVGADLYLTGEATDAPPDNIPLPDPAAPGCAGPYWLSGPDVRIAEFVARDGQPPLLDATDNALIGEIQYAATYQVTLAVERRRAVLQEPLGPLNAALETNENATFAGLWVEHEPEFKVVAWFTHDGRATIDKYLDPLSPLAGVLEVRDGARWTETDLLAQQEEAGRILAQVGINGSSATDIPHGQVTFWVADPEEVAAALSDAGLTLPEAVVLIAIDDINAGT